MRQLQWATLTSISEDTVMEDAPMVARKSLSIEIPLEFDFDFELSELNSKARSAASDEPDLSHLELRSPRTPTYKGEHGTEDGQVSPFDADRFFDFPLLSPLKVASPIGILSCLAAAKSHVNLVQVVGSKENQNPKTPPPPKDPLLWIWTCHLCRSRYPLSATRRCLVDGHYYCSGGNTTASQRNVKKKKRGQACSSEFDYVGWQEWGDWKTAVKLLKNDTDAARGTTGKRRNCNTCEYPSQCRYEKLGKIPDVVTAVTKTEHSPVVQSKVKKGTSKKLKEPTEATESSQTKMDISSDQKSENEKEDIRTANAEAIPRIEIHTVKSPSENSDSISLQTEGDRSATESSNSNPPDFMDFSLVTPTIDSVVEAVEEAMQDITSILTDSDAEKSTECSTSNTKKTRRGALDNTVSTTTWLSGSIRLRSKKKSYSEAQSAVK